MYLYILGKLRDMAINNSNDARQSGDEPGSINHMVPRGNIYPTECHRASLRWIEFYLHGAFHV